MQNELAFLMKLQEHDSAVDALKEKADAFTPRIAEKNRQMEAMKNSFKSAKDKLQTHQLKKKELELEVDSKEKEIAKLQGGLNSVKTNDAYRAMLAEIDNHKQALRKIEDGILEVMEAIDQEDKEVKAAEKEMKVKEGSMRAEVSDLEGQKEKILAEAKVKEDERNVYAATVPPALLSQYDSIREKRGGVAICPMVNNSCSGCHMGLPPHKANEIKKAKSMILCENCSRILYLPPTDAAPAASPQPASVPAVPSAPPAP